MRRTTQPIYPLLFAIPQIPCLYAGLGIGENFGEDRGDILYAQSINLN